MEAIVNGLTDAVSSIGTFLVQFVGFLLVLAIGWIVARVVQRVIAGVLHRVHFDRLVERGGVKKALARTGYDASGLLARIGFWAVMLITLTLAFNVFGPNPISAVLASIVAYLPRVFAAAVIVIVGAAVAVVVREAVDAAVGGVGYGKTLAAIAGGAVLYIATFMALDSLNIAESIVTGLFYASLAAIAGTIIVAAGGGGIPVMQRWWERASTRAETDAPMIAQGASERVKQRAEQRTEQAKEMREKSREKVGAGTPRGGTGGPGMGSPGSTGGPGTMGGPTTPPRTGGMGAPQGPATMPPGSDPNQR